DCRVQWNRGHGEKSFCNGDSPVQRARRTTFRQRERSADTSGAGANRGRNSIAAQFSEAVVCEEVWHVSQRPRDGRNSAAVHIYRREWDVLWSRSSRFRKNL